jgi:hypothetical protein
MSNVSFCCGGGFIVSRLGRTFSAGGGKYIVSRRRIIIAIFIAYYFAINFDYL